MARRLRRQRTLLLKQLIQDGRRCIARHPNWHGARCERRRDSHIVHSSDDGSLVWVDERPAVFEVVGHD